MSKEKYMQTKEREFQTTLKVLKAYPKDKQDIKPHATKSKSAKELARNFAQEEAMCAQIIDGAVDWNKMPQLQGDIDEAIKTYESEHAKTMEKLKNASEEDLQKPINFFGGEMSRMDAMHEMLHDAIHHRGQFSVYMRLADGKLPMIYGPTADEPWEGPTEIK